MRRILFALFILATLALFDVGWKVFGYGEET